MLGKHKGGDELDDPFQLQPLYDSMIVSVSVTHLAVVSL